MSASKYFTDAFEGNPTFGRGNLAGSEWNRRRVSAGDLLMRLAEMPGQAPEALLWVAEGGLTPQSFCKLREAVGRYPDNSEYRSEYAIHSGLYDLGALMSADLLTLAEDGTLIPEDLEKCRWGLVAWMELTGPYRHQKRLEKFRKLRAELNL